MHFCWYVKVSRTVLGHVNVWSGVVVLGESLELEEVELELSGVGCFDSTEVLVLRVRFEAVLPSVAFLRLSEGTTRAVVVGGDISVLGPQRTGVFVFLLRTFLSKVGSATLKIVDSVTDRLDVGVKVPDAEVCEPSLQTVGVDSDGVVVVGSIFVLFLAGFDPSRRGEGE